MRGLESLRSNVGLLNSGRDISETYPQLETRVSEHKKTLCDRQFEDFFILL